MQIVFLFLLALLFMVSIQLPLLNQHARIAEQQPTTGLPFYTSSFP